jgi:hypothetical protein
MKKRNLVAKHMSTRTLVYKDKKKEQKKGVTKYSKKKVDTKEWS